ncbi:MAG: CHAT domain-containing protein [Pyrinomonadaceae bacterium]
MLDEQTVLLEYSLGAERSYLWAVSPQTVSLFRLPSRAQVDKMAIDLREQLIPAQLRRQITGIDVIAGDQNQRGLGLGAATQSSTPTTNYAAAAYALYKAVFEPAASMAAGKRLLIVADGALNYVPFEALVSSRPLALHTTPYLTW